MSSKTIISLEHISAGYDDKTVFTDVSVSIDSNDYVGIIGPNGGGKTTLMKLILGLIKPQRGTIKYYRDGKQVENITMGYLPQYNAIDRKFPISVMDVVLSGLNTQAKLSGSYSREQREKALEVLRMLEIENLRDSHIGILSGGQMQRALLGRAIVSKPEVIILDEPNTYIDKHLQQQMFQLLSSINHECAILLVSHDIKSIESNAHRLLLVNHSVVEKLVEATTDADIETCFENY